MFTIVDFYGKQADYSCGYCKQPTSCQTHGMWAHTMTCQDYQDLIDRGWRRSGCYCYKPEMHTTCCPSYTIKCDATRFRLSKSHKKTIKRVNKFLKDGVRAKDDGDGTSDADRSAEDGSAGGDLEMGDVARNPRKELNLDNVKALVRKEDGPVARDAVGGMCLAKDPSAGSSSDLSTKSSTGGRNPPKKAKLLRIERKREKLIQKGLKPEELDKEMQEAKGKNVEKSLEDFLAEEPAEGEQSAHRLKLVIVCTSSNEFKRTKQISFGVYKKYQTEVHNDPPNSIEEYLDFLVKSPLQYTTGQNSPSCGFGSFHQQYWLDDRLIAVGVIDILPSCVSSVYFFYDPEYRFLSLGTYASLRELAFTRKMQQHTPSITNYYMGFYIHSCPKMRYKSNLYPSYLLCPEVYSWHPLDAKVVAMLDKSKYCRFNENPKAVDQNAVSSEDVLDVLILHGSSYKRYGQYMKTVGLTVPAKNTCTYAKLVGKVCSSRMLLYEG
ncbi:arginyl-tRNA--protein transferase 1 isoform X1 [Ochlerotatus camptorhynchus]|uniref:arginyl-tRNA--protein transferase 1 isoform X1 n=1 Tax=Ochlerotatus camptorhynchus TaxID=644619 RepID=UPI0031D988A7